MPSQASQAHEPSDLASDRAGGQGPGGRLTDADWSRLVAAIERGACTPLLGAGVHDGRAPLPEDIALQWSETGGYPLEDRWNLARVAQFMAIDRGPRWPRDQLAAALVEAEAAAAATGKEGEAIAAANDPLRMLAELPLRTYVTTTPDDRLTRALRNYNVRHEGKSLGRRPRADFCRWHEALRSSSLASTFEEDPHYVPSVEEPFVFHLHGQVAVAQSLVVSEDDHLDMLVTTARHPLLIPPAVQRALRGGPLLLLGQPIADWNFRALLRSLCGGDFGGLQAGTVSVHVAPENDEVRRYLEKLYGKLHIKVFWGTPQEFLTELRERLDRAQTK